MTSELKVDEGPDAVVVQAAANDAGKAKTALQIGDLDDGGVYVGKSATTGKDLHAAFEDEQECLTYWEARDAAEQLKCLHPTAHVPTSEELNVNLYQNRDQGALEGTFNTSGSYPRIVYRSCSRYCDDFNELVQWFEDGFQSPSLGHVRLAVRLVW